MADVANTIAQWSTTASSNSPGDSTSVGSGLGDNLRTLQSVVRTYFAHYAGGVLASAATIDLGAAAGLFVEITGTTTITSFGSVSAGIWKVVRLQGALTLTHNASSLILPGGASIATATGDYFLAFSRGPGTWTVPFYQKADGTSPILINGLTAETLPDTPDAIAIYDASAGANRKMTLANMLKVVIQLAIDSAPDIATDYLLTYDASASAAKRVLLSSFAATTSAPGVVELATAAETLGGTDLTRAMTPGNFVQGFFDPDGYFQFPGGFTIQWGTHNFTTSGADIAFPHAFPNACVGFAICPVNNSPSSVNNVFVHTIVSVSIFRLWAPVAQQVRWIAVGY